MIGRILLLPGDGIGEEAIVQAEKIFHAIGRKFGRGFELKKALVAGAAMESAGVPIPEETLRMCMESDAVILGAWGSSKWSHLPEMHPSHVLRIRKAMNVYLNLRATKVYRRLTGFSPLKERLIQDADILIVREISGGAYFGEKKNTIVNGEETASDLLAYTSSEIERVGRRAFEFASGRKGKVVSADKAGPLASSDLWRKTMNRIAADYPGVELEHILVDNCAMEMIMNPSKFDVIVSENAFGDILSDVAAALTGLPAMATSVCLGDGPALYEVSHGSHEDIAGKDIYNPIAVILIVALLLRHTFGLEREAGAIEAAVEKVLSGSHRTPDMTDSDTAVVGTNKMTDLVIAEI